MLLIRLPVATIPARMPDRRFAASEWRGSIWTRHDGGVSYARGWPATITEPSLLSWPVTLRPLAARDAKPWREARVRNAEWLRPWEPTNPETPLYQTSLGPYIAMVRTMRREAKHGVTLPRGGLVGGRVAGPLAGRHIILGSARAPSLRSLSLPR